MRVTCSLKERQTTGFVWTRRQAFSDVSQIYVSIQPAHNKMVMDISIVTCLPYRVSPFELLHSMRHFLVKLRERHQHHCIHFIAKHKTVVGGGRSITQPSVMGQDQVSHFHVNTFPHHTRPRNLARLPGGDL